MSATARETKTSDGEMEPLHVPRYERMTEDLLQQHLKSGQPFVTRDVGPLPSPRQNVRNISDLISYLSSSKYGGEFSHHGDAGPSFVSWHHSDNNAATLETLPMILQRWPSLYFATVANHAADISIVSDLFSSPHFVSPADSLGVSPKWIYFGHRGPGVQPHIDSVGCVCSWSYLLHGEKRWTLSTPPGQTPVQGAVVDLVAGDFFFWCVGYFHSTEVLSDEAFDVHGYLNLLHPPPSSSTTGQPPPSTDPYYSTLISHYASAVASEEPPQPSSPLSYRVPFHGLMRDVASSCLRSPTVATSLGGSSGWVVPASSGDTMATETTGRQLTEGVEGGGWERGAAYFGAAIAAVGVAGIVARRWFRAQKKNK